MVPLSGTLLSLLKAKRLRRAFVRELPYRSGWQDLCLRRYFLYDRYLLSDLSRCVWESLKLFLQEVRQEKNSLLYAVIEIQTLGCSSNISTT
jgi:hypothetical protein